jgi:hypothetical protein
MSESFNKLKALLEEKGKLAQEEIDAVTKEHGAMEQQELVELESLKLKKGKETRKEVSMEEYLKAADVLESAAEGSEEYKKAEEIVKAFESGG